MVLRLPGTDVELSRRTFDQVSTNARRAKLSTCGYLLVMALLTTVFLLLVIGVSGFVVIYLVLSIVSLEAGARTYQQAPDCQHTIGVWLVVFGSLGLSSLVLELCCGPKDSEGNKLLRPNVVSCMIILVEFGWLCYGVNIVYFNPSNYPVCNPSQWQVFQLVVMIMFWGAIATIAVVLLLYFFLLPLMGWIASESEHQPVDVEMGSIQNPTTKSVG